MQDVHRAALVELGGPAGFVVAAVGEQLLALLAGAARHVVGAAQRRLRLVALLLLALHQHSAGIACGGLAASRQPPTQRAQPRASCHPASPARACPAAAARSACGCSAHGGVELGVVAGHVGAQLDQVARLVVARQQLARAPRRGHVLAAGHAAHHARDRALDVDGREVPGLGQLARQHDVAVEDAARRVGDRVLRVVAFAEHGVEGGDRAAGR